jgi:EAL domain-containing protein (putative c-di-GMP-specific phosphodiesterase class I)
MQPIIQLNTGEVMGYEFLMRPRADAAQFRPDQLAPSIFGCSE